MRGPVAVLMFCACASAGDAPIDAPGKGDGGPDASYVMAEMCPVDQVAFDASSSGQLTCTTVDSLTRQAISDHCSVYLGWRDSCDGCTTPPAKWGRVSSTTCSPGVGVNNTCTMPNLGGIQVS